MNFLLARDKRQGELTGYRLNFGNDLQSYEKSFKVFFGHVDDGLFVWYIIRTRGMAIEMANSAT
jgi:hypothetical protein